MAGESRERILPGAVEAGREARAKWGTAWGAGRSTGAAGTGGFGADTAFGFGAAAGFGGTGSGLPEAAGADGATVEMSAESAESGFADDSDSKD